MTYHANIDLATTLDANGVQQEKLQSELSKFNAVHDHGNSGSSSAATNRGPSWAFQVFFEEEVRRLSRFVNSQQEGMELAAKATFLRANDIATGTRQMQIRSAQESYALVHGLKRETNKVVDDCLTLQRFLTMSRKILFDNASMADEKLRGAVDCTSLVHEILPKAHINSSLVCVVSDIYSALRLAEEMIVNQSNNSGGEDLWQAPSSFQRATTKYWVKDENLTKLMMACACEAPLLVYGKKGPLTSTKRSDLSLSEGDKLWDTLATRITSIYFDSDTMSLYKERLARAEGAQLLRARWYGTTMPLGDKIIFLELKTHHEKWVAQKSVKERASIKECDMINFIRPVRWNKKEAEQMILRAKPKMKAEELPKATDLLFRMHNLVVKHKLSACVRSVYDRAAFQSAKSNDLRLTLDRNVRLVNEREKQPNDGEWCLNDTDAQTARTSVVPYNVFEVKLASDDPMPAGLAEAQNDSTIELATKFSKFTTGAAVFNAVPTLPYWAAHPAFHSFFELDKRGSQSFSSDSDDSFAGDYILMGATSNLPKGVAIAPKYPARIEPKTYFAHERTFVQWISASILLLNISGYLLNAGNFEATAAAISFSAFVLVLYSTSLYIKRLNLLKVREPHGYLNKVNPIFLTCVVGFTIFLIWTDSVKGSDIFDVFSFSEGHDDRRLLQMYPQNVIGVNSRFVKKNPSSFMIDVQRHSFLMTAEDSIYVQPMDENMSGPSDSISLVRVNKSHLQGLATVGDHLFTVSDGPDRTELIELSWWGAQDGNERLRVTRRWTIEDRRTKVSGFSIVPSTDSAVPGSFYINMNSSIRIYSLPVDGKNLEAKEHTDHLMRLKSLNMKGLGQATIAGDNETNDSLSTMITFEGLTYILKPKRRIVEAWNLTDGTFSSEIALPITENSGAMKDSTGFALERRAGSSKDTPTLRGSDMPSSDKIILHLLTGEDTTGVQILSFPVLENKKVTNGQFSNPHDGYNPCD